MFTLLGEHRELLQSFQWWGHPRAAIHNGQIWYACAEVEWILMCTTTLYHVHQLSNAWSWWSYNFTFRAVAINFYSIIFFLLCPHSSSSCPTFPYGVSASISCLSWRISGSSSPVPPMMPICIQNINFSGAFRIEKCTFTDMSKKQRSCTQVEVGGTSARAWPCARR